MSDGPVEAEKLTGDALTIEFLKANLAELRTGGIITVAMTNPNVMSYMEHWEDRAEKAEARLSEAVKVLEEAVKQIEDERIAWSGSEYSGGFNDGCNTAIRIVRSKSKAFLATLGEENVG